MKNKLNILIFGLLISITVSSQVTENTYTATFERKVREPWSGTWIWDLKITEDTSFLKNIPDIACDESVIKSFKLNQYLKTDSIPNQMYLFIGINEHKKEKYIVMDANNNHDFSDEQVYTFSLLDESLTMEEKRERAVALQILPDPNKNELVNIGIDPFNYYVKPASPQEARLMATIVFPEYMNAQTQIESLSVEIDAYPAPNLFQRDLDEKTSFTIIYNDKAGKQTNRRFNSPKDTIHINDKLYKLSEIQHPNIYLKEIGVLADSSSIGSFMPVVYAQDLDNDSPVSINELIKDKYVFVDFWGSWCTPCIASIPKLKSFHEKIKNRSDVSILGIAQEKDKKGVEQLKEIISTKQIEWLNLWIARGEGSNTTSIVRKLDVKAFPTYLIIDNTGKIVYRENNSKNTQAAIDFFMDLINK